MSSCGDGCSTAALTAAFRRHNHLPMQAPQPPRCAAPTRSPMPASRYFDSKGGEKRPYFVLVGGEGPCEDPLKRSFEHSSLCQIGDAYARLRKHFPREQIIVIAQLQDHLVWLVHLCHQDQASPKHGLHILLDLYICMLSCCPTV